MKNQGIAAQATYWTSKMDINPKALIKYSIRAGKIRSNHSMKKMNPFDPAVHVESPIQPKRNLVCYLTIDL